MDRERAVQIAVGAVRAAAKDYSVYNRQRMNQEIQNAKAAGATETEIFDAANNVGDLYDHS